MSKYCYAVCLQNTVGNVTRTHSRVVETNRPMDSRTDYVETIERIAADVGYEYWAVLSFTIFYWPELAKGGQS